MKIAAVQMDVQIGNCDANMQTMLAHLSTTTSQGASLTIFPECALTGYCFDQLDEAKLYAQPADGPASLAFADLLKTTGGYVIYGMLEPSSDGVYNAAVLVGPQGVIGTYRKIHLPHLGVDTFSAFGEDPFKVYDIDGVNVGIGICYDSAFPESIRCMALQGADLIALPTNFPAGAEMMTRNVINTRAMENAVYFAGVNRIGTERGFRFIGESLIVAPSGKTIQQASGTDEEILYADIDVELARNKRVIRTPGKHAIDRLADRRPEMYAALTEPHQRLRPRNDPAYER